MLTRFLKGKANRFIGSAIAGLMTAGLLVFILSFTTDGSVPSGTTCSGVLRRVVPFMEAYRTFAAFEFDTFVCVFSVSPKDIAQVPLGKPLNVTQQRWRRIDIEPYQVPQK